MDMRQKMVKTTGNGYLYYLKSHVYRLMFIFNLLSCEDTILDKV
jgi:hypothetical protein